MLFSACDDLFITIVLISVLIVVLFFCIVSEAEPSLGFLDGVIQVALSSYEAPPFLTLFTFFTAGRT